MEQIELILFENEYDYDDVMDNRWEYPYTLNEIAESYWLHFCIEKNWDDEDPYRQWSVKLVLDWLTHFLFRNYTFNKWLSMQQLHDDLTRIKREIDSIQEHVDQLSIYDLNNYEW